MSKNKTLDLYYREITSHLLDEVKRLALASEKEKLIKLYNSLNCDKMNLPEAMLKHYYMLPETKKNFWGFIDREASTKHNLALNIMSYITNFVPIQEINIYNLKDFMKIST